MSKPQQHWRAR
jgi:hypothetical protein